MRVWMRVLTRFGRRDGERARCDRCLRRALYGGRWRRRVVGGEGRIKNTLSEHHADGKYGDCDPLIEIKFPLEENDREESGEQDLGLVGDHAEGRLQICVADEYHHVADGVEKRRHLPLRRGQHQIVRCGCAYSREGRCGGDAQQAAATRLARSWRRVPAHEEPSPAPCTRERREQATRAT